MNTTPLMTTLTLELFILHLQVDFFVILQNSEVNVNPVLVINTRNTNKYVNIFLVLIKFYIFTNCYNEFHEIKFERYLLFRLD